MRVYQSWMSHILIGGNVLLLFLAFAADKMVLPLFLTWLGHFHPVLLHLPLGITVLSVLLWFLRKHFSSDSFDEIYDFTLSVAALSAVFTALVGLFLSRGQDYEAVMLRNHLWSGVALSFFSWFSWWAFSHLSRMKTYWSYLQCVGLGLMTFVGHAGGGLTHGADFLNWPEDNEKKEPVSVALTDSASYFQVAIRPLLEKKCVSCHKKEKAKGDLILASFPHNIGNVWVSPHANVRAMLAELALRIDLPVTDKKHMPPRGKDPLNSQEILLIKNWINAGGSTDLLLASITENHPLFPDKQDLLKANSQEKAYTFPFLPAHKLEDLNDAFTVVRQISGESPALKADFFISKAFENRKLDQLSAAKVQIIQINLSKMPVTDQDLKKLLVFQNLEKLILNQTEITDDGMNILQQFKNLEVLGLSGTQISVQAIPLLADIKSLKEVFLWHTNITEPEYQEIIKKYKNIRWHFGFSPNPDDLLPLNAPILENKSLILGEKDSIRFKIALPGSEIRYTLDGKVPDSLTSPLYTKPLVFSNPVTLRVKVFKPGWISSPVSSFSFLRQGIKPESSRLLTQPEPEYLGVGVESLTDNQLGKIDQFRAGNWLGFRSNRMEAIFKFKSEDVPLIRYVSVHYGANVPSYILAPQYVELWGGDKENKMTLLNKQVLPPLEKKNLNDVTTAAVILEIKNKPTACYKVVVNNVPFLPSFHPGKGSKGWIFIDEVFFNK